jgi:hypothetical protein
MRVVERALARDLGPGSGGARPMTTATSKSASVWLLALTSGSVALDTLLVSTALSTIRLDLGAAVDANNLSFAVLLLTTAALAERFARRVCSQQRSQCPFWRK